MIGILLFIRWHIVKHADQTRRVTARYLARRSRHDSCLKLLIYWLLQKNYHINFCMTKNFFSQPFLYHLGYLQFFPRMSISILRINKNFVQISFHQVTHCLLFTIFNISPIIKYHNNHLTKCNHKPPFNHAQFMVYRQTCQAGVLQQFSAIHSRNYYEQNSPPMID